MRLPLTRSQTLFTDGHVPTEVTWNHSAAGGSREGRGLKLERAGIDAA